MGRLRESRNSTLIAQVSGFRSTSASKHICLAERFVIVTTRIGRPSSTSRRSEIPGSSGGIAQATVEDELAAYKNVVATSFARIT
jgi:hypothetical protein